MLEMLPANSGLDRKLANNILKINDLSREQQMENLTGRYRG